MQQTLRCAALCATLAIAVMLGGCHAAPPAAAPANDPAPSATAPDEPAARQVALQVEANGATFTATLADTDAARALAEQLAAGPITIQASDYSGFEKVGNLGLDPALPASDTQTTTQPGDIVLYNDSQIVLFYGSNSWSYTMLAHVDDLAGWTDALGTGDVTVTLSTVTR